MVAPTGLGDCFLSVYFVVFDPLIISLNQIRVFARRPGQAQSVAV